MTDEEVVRLFTEMRPARQGSGYAPHKPLVVLLLLEKIRNGHGNDFPYEELDRDLRRLLEKYGGDRAAEARNEPFVRLENDGIYHVEAPLSLMQLAGTPSPRQLIDTHASAKFDPELFSALKSSSALIRKVAEQVASHFLDATVRRAVIADAAPSVVRQFWWVSQNKTYRSEIDGNFMWSPKTSADGSRNPNYDFMREMEIGDVVFSFAGSSIRAIGVVTAPASSCPKPADFGGAGVSWLDDGWLVGVAFRELGSSAVRPSEHMELLGPTLPDRYSPIRKDGTGNQIYLAPVPDLMAAALTVLIGPAAQAVVDDFRIGVSAAVDGKEDSAAADALQQRSDIGSTQKWQLVLARRGQGLFRANVGQIEKYCRVTQTDDRFHLIASHIKPWSKSNDQEKISGYNGLLLSPHVDHLFDRGYLSFEDNGRLIISKELDPIVLQQWHIDPDANVGPFRKEQKPFLEYHRDVKLSR